MSKVIVRVQGDRLPAKDFVWTGEPDAILSAAVNYASGLAWGLANIEGGIPLYTHDAARFEGWKWWSETGLTIEVLNAKGKVVCDFNDLEDDTDKE